MTGCIILLPGAQLSPYEYLFQPLCYRMVIFPSYQRSAAVSVSTPAEEATDMEKKSSGNDTHTHILLSMTKGKSNIKAS